MISYLKTKNDKLKMELYCKRNELSSKLRGSAQIPGSGIAWANFLGREIAGNACPHLKEIAG